MKKPALTLPQLLSPYRTISIIGMAKNTGKTTTLNYLIEAFYRQKIRLALTSIGRDGESVDVVTKTEKPKIFVFKDTIIATAENLLPLCDITKQIIDVTNINTPLGRIVLVRALSDGFVQLGGPSMTAQLSALLKGLPGDKVILDGAISRKSPASPNITEATVLCTGAAFSPSMHTTIEETRHTVRMLMLPCFEDTAVLEKLAAAPDEKVTAQQGCIYIRGAVFDSLVSDLIIAKTNMAGISIIAEDPSKIFIKPATYEKLLIKKAALFVKAAVNLAAVTVNPFSPYNSGFAAGDFLEEMRQAVPVSVYDLKAE